MGGRGLGKKTVFYSFRSHICRGLLYIRVVLGLGDDAGGGEGGGRWGGGEGMNWSSGMDGSRKIMR